jgi:hypothetical protein
MFSAMNESKNKLNWQKIHLRSIYNKESSLTCSKRSRNLDTDE